MKTIALFFGGLGNESEVSVMSARNVIKNFDYRRYKLLPVFWEKSDRNFYVVKDADHLKAGRRKIKIEDFSIAFDVALLMTHGRYGEDGVLQAVLESRGVKYCGCGVTSSALCMDKALLKDVLAAHAVKQVRYEYIDYFLTPEKEAALKEGKILKDFHFPIFVKPANSGSSVGITKVDKPGDFRAAIEEARRHDCKIIFEEGLINPREVEIAVMGNSDLVVSRPGELSLAKDFYDFDDKYKKGEAKSVIPARLGAGQREEVRKLAVRVYRLAGCQGFARIDFFISGGETYLNEINTLPGFTDISMFPLLMMNEGMSYRELINKIIELGKEK